MPPALYIIQDGGQCAIPAYFCQSNFKENAVPETAKEKNYLENVQGVQFQTFGQRARCAIPAYFCQSDRR